MKLPDTAEAMRNLLEDNGFEILDGLDELLQIGVDEYQNETEIFPLESLSDEQWEGLNEAVETFCGGWPSSPWNPDQQLSLRLNALRLSHPRTLRLSGGRL